MKIKILNITVDAISISKAIEKTRYSRFIFTPNLDHLFNLQRNLDFYKTYLEADLVLCDSKILSGLYFLLFGTKINTIPGSEFFPKLVYKYKNDSDFRVFLLGGTTVNHALKAKENINFRCSENVIIDFYSPAFGFENDNLEIDNIIENINNSKATVLAVGLGSPKQELFIVKYANRFTNIKTFIGIGATIDFESGLTKRAPLLYRKTGFEWFYRFLLEPKRLFRRYFIEDFRVIFYLIKDRLKIYKNPFELN
jgi:N-acetylglucosaminyldiphosphoundecaprenol N-acetyl-beta-D-mannosaminyltransferase